MNKKRFEAVHNDKDAWDIIDYKESKKINGLVIYNDLGCIYFSSAPQLCDLLNELNDKCEFLEIENESLEDGATKYAELYHKSLKENEQLKNRVDELEDDNMKYTLSTDKLDGYTKRFMPTKCINEFRDCKTNRYYWLDNEDNFTGALELLNLLDCENEELKSENRQLKGRLMEYEEQIKW